MQSNKISLIIQPGDSFFPIVSAIDKAQTSINITVFRMDDPIIQRALVQAHQRGVRVRALIASSARGWEEKNRKLLRDSKKAGLEIREPAADSKKRRFHYKIMMVDGKQSLVFTFNPTRENLHYTRDFGLVLFNERVATELNRLFEADWSDSVFEPDQDSPLFISPFNSRSKMRDFLSSAQSSIHVWDAKLTDPEMVAVLNEKAAAGVDVRVLGEENAFRVGKGSPQFRHIDRFKLHAKCTLVDGERVVLGSMNMRTQCFDTRREVNVRIDDASMVKKLESVFSSDWEQKPVTSSTAATVIQRVPVVVREPVSVEQGFVLISRTDALRRHGLREGVTSIGRADENDIVIADARASRYHAKIGVEARTCTLTDLASGNGTFLNGERITGSHPIVPGDVISIAEAEEFRFVEL